jgi:hypothetical protein
MTSRTLVVKEILNDIGTTNIVEKNNKYFLLFDTLDQAIKTFEMFKTNNKFVRYIKYQLFIKSSNKLDLESLTSSIKGQLPESNITYIRVDKNEHTGKIEFDRFSDYLALKTLNGDIKYYHFDIQRSKKRIVKN